MAILDRLLPRRSSSLAGHTRVVGGYSPVSETPGVLWGRPTSAAGVQVDEREALTLSAVFAACFRLANIAAMLPLGVYQKNDQGRTELTSHPAGRLLAVAPNPEQTAFTARHFMQFWRPLCGAACAEIGWDGAGRPSRLWPMEPWRVRPEWDDNEVLFFRVDGTRKVNAEDMVYVPHMTEDGVTGKGFIHYALESLGQAIAADRTAGKFFANDMKPAGILQHDGNPSKETRREFREEWRREHSGTQNANKTGVLWGGWKWVSTGMQIEPDKAQLLESRQFSVVEVARWLNVPPHWLAELSRATWNNIESQSIEALIYSVSPMLTAYEQEYDRKLCDPPRVYTKHNVNALLRTDAKSRGEFYRLMREIGAYTANQVLAFEDENGIGKDGDRRFVPVNWQPADDLMTGGEAQRKAAAAKVPAPTPGSDSKPASDPKPAPAAPLASAPPADSLVSALYAVADHAAGMLAKKELNEARRAAKNVNGVTRWMDEFYAGFEGTLASGLTATASLALAVKGSETAEGSAAQLAGIWAADWVKDSREQLLVAMECKAEEWPNRSAALFLSWEGRAAAAAARIAEGVRDAA